MIQGADCWRSLFNFFLSFAGQVQISLRGLLGLFNEAMQQNHVACAGAEDHAGDPALGQAAPHLPQPATERAAQWRSNRPTKFGRGNVEANDAAVGRGQRLQPVPNRLRAACRPVKDRCELLGMLCYMHLSKYNASHKVHVCKQICMNLTRNPPPDAQEIYPVYG